MNDSVALWDKTMIMNMTQNAKCVAIFVDFCKAFDSISCAQMEGILCAYQVPTELVQAIMSVYEWS